MNVKRSHSLIFALVLLGLWCPDLTAQAGTARAFRPVTQQMLSDPDPANWMMWRGGYRGWGYSPLTQIDTASVADLRLVWSFQLISGKPGSRGIQAEPLVYDGIMYVRQGDESYTAHDATTGDLIWEYRRTFPEEVMGRDVPTRLRWGLTPHRGRGMLLWEDKLIGTSTDGWMFALDMRTGVLLWETRLTDYSEVGGQQPSGAPLVFNGVIVMGYDCHADASLSPCHMSGYDAEEGQLIWRWYTSPTRDDPMHYTWGDDPQVYPLERRENMSPWMSPAIDIERGLAIFGIGSSAPQQPELAGTDGEWPDRLYHGSTVALDYRTGELVWWAQHHTDMWNDDSVFDRILVDSPLSPDPTGALGVNPDITPGEERDLVIGSFSKDGIFYAYDRSDGTFIYARPTGYQNIIQSYDGRTGAYTINPDAVLGGSPDSRATSCKDSRTVPQGAYSPLTNAYYIGAWNGGCSINRPRSVPAVAPAWDSISLPGTGYNTAGAGRYTNPVTHLGQPEAIDVATGKTLWRLDREWPMYGMLTTGGGLVFTGDSTRRFYALNQWTGETVWQVILSGVSDMAPITYAVDGRQYLAVIAPGGGGGHQGRGGPGGGGPQLRNPTGGSGRGHTMFVFALPE